MSDAKKCDRCGKFFEPIPGCLTLDIHEHKGDDTFETSEGNDLCPECSAQFEKFMDATPDG